MVLLLLVGGAIINVAVAWAAVAFVHPYSGNHRAAREWVDGPIPWEINRWDSCFVTLCISRFSAATPSAPHEIGLLKPHEVIPAWSRIQRPVLPGPPPNLAALDVGHVMADQASGWPRRALWCAWGTADLSRDVNYFSPIERDRWSIPVASAKFPRSALPLRPLWPGFAINTVFYAFVLWLLFAAPFALRRRRRIRRDLCPKCAYDLRGSTDAALCPECGAAVTSQLRLRRMIS